MAAAGTGHTAVLIAGVAGLVAGAMSMAAGEYVSVGSQADTEAADMTLERHELATAPEAEKVELNYPQRRHASPALRALVGFLQSARRQGRAKHRSRSRA